MIATYQPHALAPSRKLWPSILMIAFCLSALFAAPTIQAQETSKQDGTKAAVELTPEQWKFVEGYFQNPGNKDFYVQFTAKDKMLHAKLLWNNREIIFTPQSELEFYTANAGEGNPMTIKFTKDPAGAITAVSLGNNDVWNKAKDYKPVVKTEMVHTPGQLKPFEGVYQHAKEKDRFIQFTVKNNSLILKQHWDANELQFVPESELSFFSKDFPQFSLTFAKDNDGSINQALTLKRDTWQKLKNAAPDAAQIKAVEGKYQSKDDGDNYIQLSYRNGKLVVKQLWDGREIILDPLTDTYFYNDDRSYPLQAIKDNDGNIIQVEVLGIDLFNKVKQ